MSLNLCQFIGNLGKDPEVRYMPNGDPVANFSIGVSQTWKDKATGEKKEATEWVRCTAYGKLAEVCGQYLKKGKQVYVSGRMNTRKWQDKQGQDRYTTEIIANEMQMLDSRGGGGMGGGGDYGGGGGGGGRGRQQSSNPPDDYDQGGPSGGGGGDKGGGGEFDDDIPF